MLNQISMNVLIQQHVGRIRIVLIYQARTGVAVRVVTH